MSYPHWIRATGSQVPGLGKRKETHRPFTKAPTSKKGAADRQPGDALARADGMSSQGHRADRHGNRGLGPARAAGTASGRGVSRA